jgi:hypothetical protein
MALRAGRLKLPIFTDRRIAAVAQRAGQKSLSRRYRHSRIRPDRRPAKLCDIERTRGHGIPPAMPRPVSSLPETSGL